MENKKNLVKYGSLSHLDQECVTINKCNNIQLNEIRFFSCMFSSKQLCWHFDIYFVMCYCNTFEFQNLHIFPLAIMLKKQNVHLKKKKNV